MSLATLKKGDTVILHMFTGIAVGVKEVLAADKNTVTLETRIGTAKFSKKTGKQVSPEAKAPRFANYITEDDGSFVPSNGKSEKPVSKKAKAKAKPAAKPVEEDMDDEEDEAPVKPSKKTTAKKPAAKKAKKPAKPVEDDEGFEEADDEEYEEE